MHGIVRIQALKLFLEINSGLLHFCASTECVFERFICDFDLSWERSFIYFSIFIWKMWLFRLQSRIFLAHSVMFWWLTDFWFIRGCWSWILRLLWIFEYSRSHEIVCPFFILIRLVVDFPASSYSFFGSWPNFLRIGRFLIFLKCSIMYNFCTDVLEVFELFI